MVSYSPACMSLYFHKAMKLTGQLWWPQYVFHFSAYFLNTFRFDMLHELELSFCWEETSIYVLQLMMQSVRYSCLSLVISSLYQEIIILILKYQIFIWIISDVLELLYADMQTDRNGKSWFNEASFSFCELFPKAFLNMSVHFWKHEAQSR